MNCDTDIAGSLTLAGHQITRLISNWLHHVATTSVEIRFLGLFSGLASLARGMEIRVWVFISAMRKRAKANWPMGRRISHGVRRRKDAGSESMGLLNEKRSFGFELVPVPIRFA